MKPLRFYEHFACAYGTLWLGIMVLALLSQSHINAGEFGMFGFPIISLLYALMRKTGDNAQPDEQSSLRDEIQNLQRRLDQMDSPDQ